MAVVLQSPGWLMKYAKMLHRKRVHIMDHGSFRTVVDIQSGENLVFITNTSLYDELIASPNCQKIDDGYVLDVSVFLDKNE